MSVYLLHVKSAKIGCVPLLRSRQGPVVNRETCSVRSLLLCMHVCRERVFVAKHKMSDETWRKVTQRDDSIV